MRLEPILEASNCDGTVTLRCSVAGYEFPNVLTDNWILVHLNIQHGPDTFERVDPALEAHDLVAIRDWFSALAERRLPRYGHLTFIEPCLSFEFLGAPPDCVRFAIHLQAELRPKFSLRQFSGTTPDWSVVFEFGPERLAAVARAADALAQCFPVRALKD